MQVDAIISFGTFEENCNNSLPEYLEPINLADQ